MPVRPASPKRGGLGSSRWRNRGGRVSAAAEHLDPGSSPSNIANSPRVTRVNSRRRAWFTDWPKANDRIEVAMRLNPSACEDLLLPGLGELPLAGFVRHWRARRVWRRRCAGQDRLIGGTAGGATTCSIDEGCPTFLAEHNSLPSRCWHPRPSTDQLISTDPNSQNGRSRCGAGSGESGKYDPNGLLDQPLPRLEARSGAPDPCPDCLKQRPQEAWC